MATAVGRRILSVVSDFSILASKVSNKVKSKIKSEENGSDCDIGSGDSHHSDHGFSDAALSDHRKDAASSGASTPRGDTNLSPFKVFSWASHEENSPVNPSRDSGDESEGKPGMSKIITSKAEAWIGKKGLSWPWKVNERDGSEIKTSHLVWPWLHNDQENELGEHKSASAILKSENQVSETNRTANSEASGSWSSPFNVNNTSTASSGGSTSSTAVNKIDMVSDYLDYEILWEDLTIGEQIGQGSCGTVYHAMWYGSDVAVKVFSRQEYSDDVIFSFRQEVLYRFLEFFSNFDRDNFCVSLWGPVPISSLLDVTAEPPRKDSGEFLFSKLFLDACSSVYVVFPGGHENNGQPFVSKHFNVIDPFRVNNNLGRSEPSPNSGKPATDEIVGKGKEKVVGPPPKVEPTFKPALSSSKACQLDPHLGEKRPPSNSGFSLAKKLRTAVSSAWKDFSTTTATRQRSHLLENNLAQAFVLIQDQNHLCEELSVTTETYADKVKECKKKIEEHCSIAEGLQSEVEKGRMN
ncbi:putative serine/threonine-protein kinase PITSLRE [Forsythia ovata]|uniref:Serine/threonine-protein kinase PITSLRE n=1 Tax=Forsythia ovata TaxID=205694 RepID=A0ABD1TP22_9LAMI